MPKIGEGEVNGVMPLDGGLHQQESASACAQQLSTPRPRLAGQPIPAIDGRIGYSRRQGSLQPPILVEQSPELLQISRLQGAPCVIDEFNHSP